jgi:hypothetical protein
MSYQETQPWDIPLMVTRGYPSVSYLHEAAEAITEQRKPTFIYYYGDHDPSGRDITRATESGLREFAPDAEIHSKRMAVTQRQIKILQLPTRFEGKSVEVDAIPSATLRGICSRCITSHIDQDELARLRLVEEQERAKLEHILHNPEVEL